jgi:hypothetical protein
MCPAPRYCWIRPARSLMLTDAEPLTKAPSVRRLLKARASRERLFWYQRCGQVRFNSRLCGPIGRGIRRARRQRNRTISASVQRTLRGARHHDGDQREGRGDGAVFSRGSRRPMPRGRPTFSPAAASSASSVRRCCTAGSLTRPRCPHGSLKNPSPPSAIWPRPSRSSWRTPRPPPPHPTSRLPSGLMGGCCRCARLPSKSSARRSSTGGARCPIANASS